MRSSHSPTIRSRYDYYYSSLSPASSAANFYDNQNQSLFGDPVPPVTDFIETLDNHLYGSFRRGSSMLSPQTQYTNDAFMEDFLAAQNTAHRLNMSAKRNNINNNNKNQHQQHHHHQQQHQQQHQHQQHHHHLASASPITDSTFQRDDIRLSGKRRSSTSFTDEFRANLDAFGSANEILIPTAPKRLFSEEPINYRNMISIQSSDSQNGSTNEWIRPTTSFPRPASRNVMQIDHSNGIQSILPDSSTPSSDENTKPSSSSFDHIRQIQVLPYQNNNKTNNNTTTTTTMAIQQRTNTGDESSSEDYLMSASPPRRDVSPAILTDTIMTGSEFRIQPSRLHKKTSFTIINELEPNQSRPGSPSGGRASPFRGKGFRSSSSKRFPRTTSCPESPQNVMQIDSSQTSHDDIQIHRPSVHFNVIPPIPRKRTAIQVLDTTTTDDNANHHLHHHHHSSFGDVSYQDRDMESFEMLSNDRLRSGSRRGSIRGIKPSPAPRKMIQRSSSNLNKKEIDESAFVSPAVNPRSYHKGLLGVVSTTATNLSPSRIPRRKSSVSTPSLVDHHHQHNQLQPNRSASSSRKNSLITSSTDRLNFRRDSSAYSGRRKQQNTDLGGSMIDLGVTPSSSRSMNRISKPTTLSPIVGTPNKDCECDSSSHCRHHQHHDSPSKSNHRRHGSNDSNTLTKIPIRRSSSVSLNTNRTGSRSNSRETSPPKTASSSNRSSPTKIPQKINHKPPSTSTSTISPSKVAKSQMNNTDSTAHKTANTVNKELSSAKKEPAITHEKSSVKKPPAGTMKPESSTLKRQPSNIKRENSQLKLKRENSTLTPKQIATAKIMASGGGGGGRREASLLKNQSDSSLAKRLEKKNSFKNKRRTSSESDGLNEIGTKKLNDDLTNLTKQLTNGVVANGISMTTAAVTSQPVQITTAVTDHLSKTNSSGQIMINGVAPTMANPNGSDGNNNLVTTNNNNMNDTSNKIVTTTETTIIETSSSTSPNAMQVETGADKMDVTIENGELKSTIEISDNMDPVAVLQKKASSRTLKSDGLGTPITVDAIQKTMDNSKTLIDSPIETKVNVIDNVLGDSVNGDRMVMNMADEIHTDMSTQPMIQSQGALKADATGQDNGGGGGGGAGMSKTDDGAKDEMSENGDAEDDQTTCCKLCKCCTPCYASALCLPCRRLKKSSSCCKRSKKDDKKATEIATSILNENEKATDKAKQHTIAKESCWKRMKCCNRKKQQIEEKIMDEMTTIEQQATQATQSTIEMAKDTVNKERGKCALCLGKIFCCRKTNKIQTMDSEMGTAMDAEPSPGCCSCLPCRRKKKEPMAWRDTRQDSLASVGDLPKKGCCSRLCEKLMCCKKKEVVESRRTSMNSKKQSIAPTLPPEDLRPKIDESLVDHTSLMKGAIPVLPIGLAWFCLICNCLIPGFGTICSGIFCLCLGIPRFSQHDGARARIGSFFVNTFVGIAQAFTLIFCLVGWGWSIWWGMIMLRTARKHRKLLQTTDADLEEAQTIGSQSTSNQPILSQAHRDIEAGRHRN